MKSHRGFVFPDPSQIGETDIVGILDNLSVDILYQAYSQGIFPWPHEGWPLLWFCPQERAILEFAKIHLSRSLRKFLRTTDLKVTFNEDFPAVIEACSHMPRPNQKGTWINESMKRAYTLFHHSGYAHSVEVWDKGVLVGGLYGVYVRGVFSAESMFYKQDNASKLALWHLTETLKAKGHHWMDIQMLTPHMEKWGAMLIPRARFLQMLTESHRLYPDRL